MKQSDVRGQVGEEQECLPRVLPALGQDSVRNALEPAKREADDEWLALAAEDPAFFIKPSDTV